MLPIPTFDTVFTVNVEDEDLNSIQLGQEQEHAKSLEDFSFSFFLFVVCVAYFTFLLLSGTDRWSLFGSLQTVTIHIDSAHPEYAACRSAPTFVPQQDGDHSRNTAADACFPRSMEWIVIRYRSKARQDARENKTHEARVRLSDHPSPFSSYIQKESQRSSREDVLHLVLWARTEFPYGYVERNNYDIRHRVELELFHDRDRSRQLLIHVFGCVNVVILGACWCAILLALDQTVLRRHLSRALRPHCHGESDGGQNDILQPDRSAKDLSNENKEDFSILPACFALIIVPCFYFILDISVVSETTARIPILALSGILSILIEYKMARFTKSLHGGSNSALWICSSLWAYSVWMYSWIYHPPVPWELNCNYGWESAARALSFPLWCSFLVTFFMHVQNRKESLRSSLA